MFILMRFTPRIKDDYILPDGLEVVWLKLKEGMG